MVLDFFFNFVNGIVSCKQFGCEVGLCQFEVVFGRTDS